MLYKVYPSRLFYSNAAEFPSAVIVKRNRNSVCYKFLIFLSVFLKTGLPFDLNRIIHRYSIFQKPSPRISGIKQGDFFTTLTSSPGFSPFSKRQTGFFHTPRRNYSTNRTQDTICSVIPLLPFGAEPNFYFKFIRFKAIFMACFKPMLLTL